MNALAIAFFLIGLFLVSASAVCFFRGRSISDTARRGVEEDHEISGWCFQDMERAVVLLVRACVFLFFALLTFIVFAGLVAVKGG